jgi:hypothetical protein
MDKIGGNRSHSMVLGGLAETMGAKMRSTIHHRGEHEVGAIVHPDEEHVYVPRASWTSSHELPLKATHAAFDKQHYVADELRRLANEERKKEYYRREVDRQIEERDRIRSTMKGEKQGLQGLLRDDSTRHEQDQQRVKEENLKKIAITKMHLDDQSNEYARRAHEHRLREAQEHAEMKLRTSQALCEELAAQGRRKKAARDTLQKAMAEDEANRIAKRQQRMRDHEADRQLIKESLMQDEMRQTATKSRVQGAQDDLDRRCDVYERTAGKANRDRDQAEVDRQDRDEKRHMLRTDAYLVQRERARERQRHNMIDELNRQKMANETRSMRDRMQKQAEGDALKVAAQRSMDADALKAQQKKAEEQKLQHELRIMMVEKEQREAEEGYRKPAALSTMKMSMQRSNSVDISTKVDAARHMSKPLGRPERAGESVVPLDASPSTIRRITKDRSFKGDVPLSSVLGGVVGTLGGGGGAVHSALMATGGAYLPRTTGLAVQERKLASSWYEGLRPEELAAGRKKARAREAAMTSANHDG